MIEDVLEDGTAGGGVAWEEGDASPNTRVVRPRAFVSRVESLLILGS